MKRFLAGLALFSATAFGCATTPADIVKVSDSQATQISTSAADLVLSKIAPGLLSTSEAAAAAKAAAEKIVADRTARGEDTEAPLSAREWLEIAGAIGIGLLGLNQSRNSKYVKAGKGAASNPH